MIGAGVDGVVFCTLRDKSDATSVQSTAAVRQRRDWVLAGGAQRFPEQLLRQRRLLLSTRGTVGLARAPGFRRRLERRFMIPPSSIAHACTVDLEDYFHATVFESVISEATGPPSRRVSKATDYVLKRPLRSGRDRDFFVLARSRKGLLNSSNEFTPPGHEIGSHSDEHRLLYRMTPAEIPGRPRTSKRRIEDLIGTASTPFELPRSRSPLDHCGPSTFWSKKASPRIRASSRHPRPVRHPERPDVAVPHRTESGTSPSSHLAR